MNSVSWQITRDESKPDPASSLRINGFGFCLDYVDDWEAQLRALLQRMQHSKGILAVVMRSRTDARDEENPARESGEPASGLPTSSDPTAKLNDLKQRFLARTREDLNTLTGLRERGAWRDPELGSIVHRLSGTAGMLGFSAISAIAGRLDDDLASNNAVGTQSLEELLAAMKEATSSNC